jgi:hypothetical protein
MEKITVKKMKEEPGKVTARRDRIRSLMGIS